MSLTKNQLMALLADNNAGEITAQDMRDVITELLHEGRLKADGSISMEDGWIPTDDQDLPTKLYVDDEVKLATEAAFGYTRSILPIITSGKYFPTPYDPNTFVDTKLKTTITGSKGQIWITEKSVWMWIVNDITADKYYPAGKKDTWYKVFDFIGSSSNVGGSTIKYATSSIFPTNGDPNTWKNPDGTLVIAGKSNNESIITDKAIWEWVTKAIKGDATATPPILDIPANSWVKVFNFAATKGTGAGDLLSDGSIPMDSHYVPVDDQDISTKKYVDDTRNTFVQSNFFNIEGNPNSLFNADGDIVFKGNNVGQRLITEKAVWEWQAVKLKIDLTVIPPITKDHANSWVKTFDFSTTTSNGDLKADGSIPMSGGYAPNNDQDLVTLLALRDEIKIALDSSITGDKVRISLSPTVTSTLNDFIAALATEMEGVLKNDASVKLYDGYVPYNDNELVNKKYVDDNSGSIYKLDEKVGLLSRVTLPLSVLKEGMLVYVKKTQEIYTLQIDPTKLTNTMTDWKLLGSDGSGSNIEFVRKFSDLPNRDANLKNGSTFIIELDFEGNPYHRMVVWDASIKIAPNTTVIKIQKFDRKDEIGSQSELTKILAITPDKLNEGRIFHVSLAGGLTPLAGEIFSGTLLNIGVKLVNLGSVSRGNKGWAVLPSDYTNTSIEVSDTSIPAVTGGWRYINRMNWVHSLDSDHNHAFDNKIGDFQTVTEKGKHGLAVFSKTGWVNLFTETDIKAWISSLSLFEGTVDKDDSSVVGFEYSHEIGATQLTGLPDLTALNTVKDISKVSHYWTWIGESNHRVTASEIRIGGDLAGAVLNPGDWLQVANKGTVDAPDLHWVHVGGDLLAKARGDTLYGLQDWIDGNYEQGSLINHRGNLYRAKQGIIIGDLAPEGIDPLIIPNMLDNKPLTATAIELNNEAELKALLAGNTPAPWSTVLVKTAFVTTTTGTNLDNRAYVFEDLLVWTGYPKLNVDDSGVVIVDGWMYLVNVIDSTNFKMNQIFIDGVNKLKAVDKWEKIDIGGGIKHVAIDADLPTKGRVGDSYLVLSSANNEGLSVIVTWNATTDSWKVIGNRSQADNVTVNTKKDATGAVTETQNLQYIMDNLLDEGFPIGTVAYFPVENTPIGWLVCDGSDFDIRKYKDLSKLLGSHTLPDYRNRFIRGASDTNLAGTEQDWSTAAPRTNFHTVSATSSADGDHNHVVDKGDHQHDLTTCQQSYNNSHNDQYSIAEGNSHGRRRTPGLNIMFTANGEHSHDVYHAGEHTHDLPLTDIVGGDPETRPDNVALVIMIKATTHRGALSGIMPIRYDGKAAEGQTTVVLNEQCHKQLLVVLNGAVLQRDRYDIFEDQVIFKPVMKGNDIYTIINYAANLADPHHVFHTLAEMIAAKDDIKAGEVCLVIDEPVKYKNGQYVAIGDVPIDLTHFRHLGAINGIVRTDGTVGMDIGYVPKHDLDVVTRGFLNQELPDDYLGTNSLNSAMDDGYEPIEVTDVTTVAWVKDEIEGEIGTRNKANGYAGVGINGIIPGSILPPDKSIPRHIFHTLKDMRLAHKILKEGDFILVDSDPILSNNSEYTVLKDNPEKLQDFRDMASLVSTHRHTSSEVDVKTASGTQTIQYVADNMLSEGSPIGTIATWPSAILPKGWLLCDGSTFDPKVYKALAKVLGGTTLPDLRNSFVRGASPARMALSNEVAATQTPTIPFRAGDSGAHSHSLTTAGRHRHGMYTHSYKVGWEGDSSCAYPTNCSGERSGHNYGGSQSDFDGSHSHTLGREADHNHTVNGGDAETRPANTALWYIIKVKEVQSSTGIVPIRYEGITGAAQTEFQMNEEGNKNLLFIINGKVLAETEYDVMGKKVVLHTVGPVGLPYSIVNYSSGTNDPHHIYTTIAAMIADVANIKLGELSFVHGETDITKNGEYLATTDTPTTIADFTHVGSTLRHHIHTGKDLSGVIRTDGSVSTMAASYEPKVDQDLITKKFFDVNLPLDYLGFNAPNAEMDAEYEPLEEQEVATKIYVDDKVSNAKATVTGFYHGTSVPPDSKGEDGDEFFLHATGDLMWDITCATSTKPLGELIGFSEIVMGVGTFGLGSAISADTRGFSLVYINYNIPNKAIECNIVGPAGIEPPMVTINGISLGGAEQSVKDLALPGAGHQSHQQYALDITPELHALFVEGSTFTLIVHETAAGATHPYSRFEKRRGYWKEVLDLVADGSVLMEKGYEPFHARSLTNKIYVDNEIAKRIFMYKGSLPPAMGLGLDGDMYYQYSIPVHSSDLYNEPSLDALTTTPDGSILQGTTLVNISEDGYIKGKRAAPLAVITLKNGVEVNVGTSFALASSAADDYVYITPVDLTLDNWNKVLEITQITLGTTEISRFAAFTDILTYDSILGTVVFKVKHAAMVLGAFLMRTLPVRFSIVSTGSAHDIGVYDVYEKVAGKWVEHKPLESDGSIELIPAYVPVNDQDIATKRYVDNSIPAMPTVDGDYKLVVAGGVATWKVI